MKDFKQLVHQLHTHEQRKFLISVLRIISMRFLNSTPNAWDISSLDRVPLDVAGSSALLRQFLTGDEVLLQAVVELLSKPEASPLTGSEGLRRVVLAALSDDDGSSSTLSLMIHLLTTAKIECRPLPRRCWKNLEISSLSDIHQLYNKKVLKCSLSLLGFS
jgi:hypothetical protein